MSLNVSTKVEKNSCLPVGLVILAAGASTRLGRPKQLLMVDECSLLRRAIESALASVCQPIAVVLGAFATRLIEELIDLPAYVVINPHWEKGMSSSIRIGIDALEAGLKIEAAIIMLCDQPFVTAEIIDDLVAAYRATGRQIVASEYGGTLGAPALFGRPLFADLKMLEEAEGAKKVINEHASQVLRIPFAQGAIDIDTPMDYARFLAMTGKQVEEAG
ncbi:MAG: nucleotidyltransferase family protein [Blastocatellia bacterium]